MSKTPILLLVSLWAGVVVSWGQATVDIEAVWRHPVFQREFLGTYGFRSDIEPKISPEERDWLENAMRLMAKRGGRDAARRLLEAQAGPQRSAVLDFTIGNLHLQGDQPERAVGWYRRAIAKFPAFLRAHKNLGLAHIRRGAPQEAAEPLARAIALGASDGMTYGLLGFAHAHGGRFAAAENAYRQAMLLQPQVTDWQLGLARCLFRLRKYEEAAALIEGLLAGEPSRVEYWTLLANTMIGQRQPMRAAEVYEWLDLNGWSTADQLNTLGDIYVNEKLFELAADAYERAFNRGAGAGRARLLRAAESLAVRGAAEEAERLVERLRAAPSEDEAERLAILKLEARLAAARGRPTKEQIALLEEIIRLDPLDGEALILLGQRYAAGGDLDRAFLYLERAAGLESHAAEATLRQAQWLVRQRRFTEAVPLIKRSLELRPREDVQRYLEQVERLARPRGQGRSES